MKAAVIHDYGGPEAIKYEDYPDPRPKPGEVLVKVAAAGINPIVAEAFVDRSEGQAQPRMRSTAGR